MPTHPRLKQARDMMRLLIQTAESARLAPMSETHRVMVYNALEAAYGHAINAECVILNPEGAEQIGYDYSDGWNEAMEWFAEAKDRMVEGIKSKRHVSFTVGNVELVPQMLRRYRNSTAYSTPKEARS